MPSEGRMVSVSTAISSPSCLLLLLLPYYYVYYYCYYYHQWFRNVTNILPWVSRVGTKTEAQVDTQKYLRVIDVSLPRAKFIKHSKVKWKVVRVQTSNRKKAAYCCEITQPNGASLFFASILSAKISMPFWITFFLTQPKKPHNRSLIFIFKLKYCDIMQCWRFERVLLIHFLFFFGDPELGAVVVFLH